MAESTLSLGYTQFAAEVGYQLGFGRTSSNWGAVGTVSSKYYQIDRCVQSAVRRVQTAYSWPWMRPVVTIILWPTVTGTGSGAPSYSSPSSTWTATTAKFYESMIGSNLTFNTSGTDYVISDTTGTHTTAATGVTVTGDASGETSGDTFTITASGDYRLPDNFGHLIGSVTFATDESYYAAVKTSENLIRDRRQISFGTAAPQIVAVRPKSTAGTTGQRFEMMVWPTPDQEYNATFRYAALPDKLDTTNVYPLGGESCSELYLRACIAEAEYERDTVRGHAERDFTAALAAAIRFHSNHEPDDLGVMSDGGSALPEFYRPGINTQATYNGVAYP